jgi:hypothetical protein
MKREIMESLKLSFRKITLVHNFLSFRFRRTIR